MEVSLRKSLVAMRTKAELQANLETTTAYVVEIPVKAADGILKWVGRIFGPYSTDRTDRAADSVIRNPPIPALHHLRRFAKTENLPSHLQDVVCPSQAIGCSAEGVPETTRIAKSTLIGNGLVYGSRNDEQHIYGEDNQRTLHFLICATSNLSLEGVAAVLKSLQPRSACKLLYQVRTITVPLSPPTSDEQAKQWSRNYWPTIYKRNNPFGPHWNIISHAEGEILDRVGDWMDLARSAGAAGSKLLLGEPVGAVIVDRKSNRTPLLIAAAGDARWGEMAKNAQSGCGNVMAHAVMRAIGLVARKRRDLIEEEASEESELDLSQIFADTPLTSVESDAYSLSRLAPGGYLCLGLEIYVTHEPCVMCSMAILHSRFARVVFGRRLPCTGGITAGVANVESDEAEHDQPGLGYGLFWRPELNWKLPAWQWIDGQGCSQVELWSPNIQA